MTTLTITHTAEDGTLLEGTARGDGSNAILRGAGWLWARSRSAWVIRSSRDRAPKLWLIEATAAKLREAGFDLEISIDTTPRAEAEAEQDRHERALARSARHRRNAESARSRSDAADDVAHRIAGGIPFGQPILVGHHSESRHRRDIARVDAANRRSYEEHQQAIALDRRADGIEHGEAHRENPQAIARRIAQFEVQQRKLERQIAGYQDHLGCDVPGASGLRLAELRSELEHVESRLEYLRGIRTQQLAEGAALELGPETVKAGDLVEYRNRWYPVLRANSKSVSVPSLAGGSWRDTIVYHQLTGHRRP